MRRLLWRVGLSVLGGGVAAFAVAEGVAWACVEVDSAGRETLWGVALPPDPAPHEALRDFADRVEAHPERGYLRYHPVCGWVPREGARNPREGGFYDAGGVRVAEASRSYSRDADGSALRVVAVGDSFTHGSEVGAEHAWPALTERALSSGERVVQVLNLGVPAYGVDQAYLRYRECGRAYRPGLVLLGLHPADVVRNVNVVPVVREPGMRDMTFSKPRFVLAGDGLALRNVPTARPAEVARAARDFAAWELASLESFFAPGMWDRAWWMRSRVLGLLAASAAVRSPHVSLRRTALRPGSEASELTLRIVADLRRLAEDEGARFAFVLLPGDADIIDVARGHEVPYAPFLAQLTAVHAGRDVIAALAAGYGEHGAALFAERGHYSEIGNAIVAREVAAWIEELVPDVFR